MKALPVVIVLCTRLLAQLALAAPSPPVGEPPELVALREAYSASLAPLRMKVDEAIKARAAKYISELQKVEDQATAAGRVKAVPHLRAEREAFAAGGWTMGFPKDAKVPAAALELRRAFDRDSAQIRAEIVPSARPLVTDYTRKLDELERKLIAAKAADGALAVREEKQSLVGAGSDPLTGSNSLILGQWYDEKGKGVEFFPKGEVTGGKWRWTDRSKRELRIDWNAGPKFYLELAVSPDGNHLVGINANGGMRRFTRKK